MEILKTTLIISLFCTGLRIISGEGMIFYFLRKPYENSQGILQQILKPIIGCVTCMASFHGIWIYIYLHGFSFDLVLCCIGAAFLNTLFYKIAESY